jgi:hypothetical protein
MKMKKSKVVSLVLITAALASCNKKENNDWQTANKGKTYVRGDSTAPYARTHHGIGSSLLWFYAFRPMFGYNNGSYGRTGFFSGGINERSNIGSNAGKARSVRGGFGRSYRAGS